MYKKSKTHMIEFEEKNKDAERMIANLKKPGSRIRKDWKQSRTTTQKENTRIWKDWKRHYAPQKETGWRSFKIKF